MDRYLDAELRARIHTVLAVTSPRAIVGFHTAAQLYGFGVIVTGGPVHLMVPADDACLELPGTVVHRAVRPLGEAVNVCGLPCLPAARVAVDLARLLPRRDALPVLDAVLRAGECSRAGLISAANQQSGLRGTSQARELVRLSDGRSRSVLASRLRLLLHDTEIDGFAVSELDDGLDFIDTRLNIGLTCGGRVAAAPGRIVRHVTDEDLHPDPDRFLTSLLRLVNHRRRARAR